MRFGLDYAVGTVSPAAHRAAGSTFACRYLSDFPVKNLSASEVAILRAAGIDIVTVWENGAADWLGGHPVGVQHAKTAEAQARELGQPAGRPILFAIDFDEAPGQTGQLQDYFRGINSVLGVERTGAYGDFYVLERVQGLARYGWQTLAWSGGQLYKQAQLYQFSNGHNVGGVSVDYNHAYAPDFGQWHFAIADADYNTVYNAGFNEAWLAQHRYPASQRKAYLAGAGAGWKQ